jgi:hypothetical protein
MQVVLLSRLKPGAVEKGFNPGSNIVCDNLPPTAILS